MKLSTSISAVEIRDLNPAISCRGGRYSDSSCCWYTSFDLSLTEGRDAHSLPPPLPPFPNVMGVIKGGSEVESALCNRSWGSSQEGLFDAAHMLELSWG